MLAANTGGGLARARELARTLPSLGPQHRYLFVAQPALARELERDGIATLGPPALPVPARLVWQQSILPMLARRRFKPHVVFSPFNYLPTRWPGNPRLAVLLSNLAPYSPTVTAMYGGREWARLRLLRRLTDRTVATAARVFVLSRQAYDLVDALGGRQAELIPMAPPPLLQRKRRPSDDEPYFVVVGDLLRYKGVEVVLDAIAGLPRRSRPLVIVAGARSDRPYAEMLERRRDELGLSDRVRFLGPLPHTQVLSLLENSLACLGCSRFENFSRVLIEALAVGAPVVAADTPSAREACGEAATYYPPTDAPALAERLSQLASDGQLRESLSTAGLRHIAGLRPDSASRRILAGLEAVA